MKPSSPKIASDWKRVSTLFDAIGQISVKVEVADCGSARFRLPQSWARRLTPFLDEFWVVAFSEKEVLHYMPTAVWPSYQDIVGAEFKAANRTLPFDEYVKQTAEEIRLARNHVGFKISLPATLVRMASMKFSFSESESSEILLRPNRAFFEVWTSSKHDAWIKKLEAPSGNIPA